MKTANCIICLEKATSYTGHVLKGDDKVTAGWCDKHAANGRNLMTALVGGYIDAFGLLDFWSSEPIVTEPAQVSQPQKITYKTMLVARDLMNQTARLDLVDKKKALLFVLSQSDNNQKLIDEITKNGLPKNIFVSLDASEKTIETLSIFAPVKQHILIKDGSIYFSWMPDFFERQAPSIIDELPKLDITYQEYHNRTLRAIALSYGVQPEDLTGSIPKS